jgi:EpsI family protein
MNFTADFTVGMLRLTGIPVFRDGTFFSIPSGNWSVVEGCSGVRYLIAAVTLGILYAYLTYTKTWKRLLFVAISVVVPIFANGLRAYMIVMIAHLSDMRYALGVDHLIYGWVFFGIVITILFFVGSFWRDPPKDEPQMPLGAAVPNGGMSSAGALAAALAAVAISTVWPGLAWAMEQGEGESHEVRLESPATSQGWRLAQTSFWDWRPNVLGTDGERFGFYVSDEGIPISLYLGVYRTQRQGAELLSSQNQMVVQKHPVWSDKEQTSRRIQLQGDTIAINQSRLESRRAERLLVWSWYRVGDRHTANPYLGKVLEALSRLFGLRRDGTLIAIAAPYEGKIASAEEILQAFVDQMLPSIDQELDRALQQSP